MRVLSNQLCDDVIGRLSINKKVEYVRKCGSRKNMRNHGTVGAILFSLRIRASARVDLRMRFSRESIKEKMASVGGRRLAGAHLHAKVHADADGGRPANERRACGVRIISLWRSLLFFLFVAPLSLATGACGGNYKCVPECHHHDDPSAHSLYIMSESAQTARFVYAPSAITHV